MQTFTESAPRVRGLRLGRFPPIIPPFTRFVHGAVLDVFRPLTQRGASSLHRAKRAFCAAPQFSFVASNQRPCAGAELNSSLKARLVGTEELLHSGRSSAEPQGSLVQ